MKRFAAVVLSLVLLHCSDDPEPYRPPSGGDPGSTAGDALAGDPGAGDPGAGDPGAGDPGAGDPGAGDPGPAGDAFSGYVNEGSFGTPIDITSIMPYAGQVAIDGTSFYRITGATVGEVYTIHLARTDGLTDISVPNAGGGGSNVCGWDNTTPGATIDCALVADSNGWLSFQIGGDDTIGGAFTLTYEAGGFVNEGSPSSPVVVTTFPFDGMALNQSYYLLSGLTPGAAYAIDFVTASAPVALFTYPDDTYQSQPNTCSVLNTDSGNPCNVAADGSGNIYLVTNYQDTLGLSYTISVEAAGVANEGGRNTPIDISSALPYDGMVHTGSSWYLLAGLTPGAAYTVTMSSATDDVRLYLYGPSFSIVRSDCQVYWSNGGGNPIDCVAAADDNGDIHIEVRGFATTDGATYTLDMAAGGLPNEGNYTIPVDITSSLPWSGTIFNGPSSYVVTGRASGTDYTVTLGSLSGEAFLSVYDTGDYSNRICNADELGTADKVCVVQTTTGELHIRVFGSTDSQGVSYTLDVAP